MHRKDLKAELRGLTVEALKRKTEECRVLILKVDKLESELARTKK